MVPSVSSLISEFTAASAAYHDSQHHILEYISEVIRYQRKIHNTLNPRIPAAQDLHLPVSHRQVFSWIPTAWTGRRQEHEYRDTKGNSPFKVLFHVFLSSVEILSLLILQSVEIHEAFLKALVIDREVVRTSVLYQFEQQGAVTWQRYVRFARPAPGAALKDGLCPCLR